MSVSMSTRAPEALHVINDIRSEFAALDLRRAIHQAGEIVGDAFTGDGAV
jgi:hypothetical protein